ncbi:DR1-like protein [Coccomyxa subellipsoidea C-169]|uniref:DR1-like protein n=1 Tax=Coccomyxa subellipsoidea (strain C-169) TaxID=574566 RepID=I0Z252_COCSC|nr:DR1-like protein [Coccomyxa subellipsoidea C-169]EIE24721.1 DR1-like protein [Coccomyxa subellipsoidea C-169]|eukprot:XP_005649265.1 DR1-like protein [Coccomyxa subellipsoidea C-169]
MEDVSLPRATVEKIVKEILPKDIRLATNTLDLLLDCCGEFIQLVYSEANTVSEEEKRSTINPEHVVRALDSLGFSSLLEDVNVFLKEVKDTDQKRSLKRHDSKAAEQNKMSEEEQIALQKKLFAEARARTLSCALPDAAVNSEMPGTA